MKCSKCGNKAIMSQKCSGVHLCIRHFEEDFQEKVKDTVNKGQMVRGGDRIAVALSGGKDSATLLHVLNKILFSQNDIELFAITVDEGIKGYREDTIKSARKITEDLGIKHIIVSFKKEYGLGLDEIISKKKEVPCTFCGVLRKSLLNQTARELGATKVATGHTLDDEAQSVMMNYLKGDIERLGRFAPRRIQPGLVPRIKPLKDIPERETALYCIVEGLYAKMVECPYAGLSLRSDIRDMMNEFEKNFPGTKQSVMKGFDSITSLLAKRYPPMDLSSCKFCKEPCVEDLCKACQLLGRFGATQPD